MNKYLLIFLILVGFGTMTHYVHSEMQPTQIFENEDRGPFKIMYSTHYEIVKKGNEYHIYLTDTIASANFYQELLRGLRQLESTDKVIIYLANYGGYVMAGAQIMNALIETPAHVTTKVYGPSYSMGALIACVGDEIILDDFAWLMFHHYSGQFAGKGAESRAIMDALDKLSRDMMVDHCVAKGILTNEQVEQVISGVDVYIHPSDL